ncbi:MAG: permease, partial [Kiritimatiellae bacterium]|nr:permease [Kiritimatiellia bacterium]
EESMSKICDLLVSFAEVFAAMSPWLVAGFFAAGVIAVWIPRAWVNRVMGGCSGFSGILRAVLVGVPLPICSCGVLPIATGLRRNGAGKGATAAFLISTPQTGIDSILATYALMGPVFAIARPLAAALTGIVGGAVVSAVGGDDATASGWTKRRHLLAD